MSRFPTICGVVAGVAGWIALRSGTLPMPEDNAGPHQPHSFLYNIGFGGYAFIFFVAGFLVGAALEHIARIIIRKLHGG